MFSRGFRHWAVIVAAAGATGAAAGSLRADPTFSRSLNGPEIAWEFFETGVPAKILAHDCIPGGARDNNGIERVAVAATAGQSVQLHCPTPPIAVVDELHLRLWVKSSRPDIQLAARIAMPRSLDPQRQTVATTIVKGAAYNRPGHWQELVVADVPKLLAAQVRVMRTTPGAAIDSHEAYLDSVVLIVPGDPNGVEVGTDQLEVEGVQLDPATITKSSTARAGTKAAAVSATSPRAAMPPRANSPVVREVNAVEVANPAVRLQGSLLLVDGKPFSPRAIQWNGEPLKFLAERGFNVVQLAAPPSAEQIADAKRHALWFICVPPRPDAIARDGLGSAGDRVLAWSLEDEAIAADPNYALRWADAIRERDAVYGRPILVAPDSGWGLAGKVGDILLARNPRVSRFKNTEYEAWLAGRPRLARPGTPVWASFNTQFGDAVRQQANALTRTAGPAPTVDAEQLESLLQTAGMNGVRGFVFQSNSSLSETDPATRNRAAQLELLNRRLQLMEPWLAGGKVVCRVASTDGRYEGVVLYVDRARLLVPYAVQPTKQPTAAAANPPTAKEITFLVPGVSESSQAYFVTPVSMRSLSSSLSMQRVAGGTRLTLPSAAGGLVVITEDPQAVQGLRQRIARQSAQTLRLERDFLVARVQSMIEIDRRLTQFGMKPNLSAADAAAMNARLVQLDSLMNSGQLELAQELVASVSADAGRLIDEQQHAAGATTGLQSSAFGLTYNRLAEFAAIQRSFENLRGGESLLAGGDFENLGEMMQQGWQHVVHPTAGAATHAELSSEQPEHGTYCLQLQATAASDGQSADFAEPRVWIVSPAVSLEADKTVEITGWVRVDQPFSTPGEGLAIIDTLGGPELSLVVGETSGWQMFRLVRAVQQPAELRLTFALTGVGSAKVDGVMVRTLQQPIARRLPAVPSSNSPGTPSTAVTPGPLSAAPKTR